MATMPVTWNHGCGPSVRTLTHGVRVLRSSQPCGALDGSDFFLGHSPGFLTYEVRRDVLIGDARLHEQTNRQQAADRQQPFDPDARRTSRCDHGMTISRPVPAVSRQPAGRARRPASGAG